jgi:short-subunit dehydrogenase
VAAAIVDAATAAIDKSTPTVVWGLKNALMASAYRFTPSKMMLTVSERIMKAN